MEVFGSDIPQKGRSRGEDPLPHPAPRVDEPVGPCSSGLAERVLDTVHRHGLLYGGETVLVAVSGGADSVALLTLLCSLQRALDLTLHVVHVHHGLRPEAEADAVFVRELCGVLGVPLHVERVAVERPRGPGSSWQGLEAEARRARYAAFRARAGAVGASCVATGHTADDQAETVLMRLLQGSGPRGLGGIAPARGAYIRPLIECRRAEIEAHLRDRGLTWVEDAMNRDLRFLRNRVRHDLVPYLREAYDHDLVESLCRGAALARRLVADIERRAGAELERLGRPGPSGVTFALAELRRLPVDLAAEILRAAAARLAPLGALRGAPERALRRLLDPESGRRPLRLGRVRIERSGPWLRVGLGVPAEIVPRRWDVPGQLRLDEVGRALDARSLSASPDYLVPRDRAAVAFDADRLPRTLTVRARRPGDRFAPWGGPGQRRLKSFLIDEGIPRWERAGIPLLEADGEIVWVVGLRRGRAAPVTPQTKRILEVTVRTPLAAPMAPE